MTPNPRNSKSTQPKKASKPKRVPDVPIPDYCQYNITAYPLFSRGIAFRVIDNSPSEIDRKNSIVPIPEDETTEDIPDSPEPPSLTKALAKLQISDHSVKDIKEDEPISVTSTKSTDTSLTNTTATSSSTASTTFTGKISLFPTLSSAHTILNNPKDPNTGLQILYTSWDRALGQSRWLQRHNPSSSSNISIQALDLDLLSYYTPIYSSPLLIEELHRRKLGRTLRTRTFASEILVYSNTLDLGIGQLFEIPAGGISRSLTTYFGTISLPQELWDEIEFYAEHEEEDVKRESPEMYYSSAFRRNGMEEEEEEEEKAEDVRKLDSVLSWFFLEIFRCRGWLDEGKLLQVVAGMSEVKGKIYGRVEVQQRMGTRCSSVSAI
ncbi:uncharacterized protein MYCFIDRAFT_214314 [Pseudocercospora fijiensis CIRAD86]|uniref:Uncharacterized protein n=1 Tax=Pseudocercospora fijiensis (strain CIRAD86) TaxID=383855 RepID=M3BBE5_PSEFD|nr:uncharacterized protein MYCFIDRAFT_214314 [Pseudocercospora fijiensis CIRAD86]EME86617.1 hypothetical protein MYCFIDRAFT_214314 [Pseudocercospora fijiensis CIRAD86]